MDPSRREQILGAARGLGPEAFNRLVESVEDSVRVGRFRFWQEDRLGRLPGVGPVSFAEFLDAFGSAPPLPVRPRPAADEPDPPTAGRVVAVHPRLGPLTLVDDGEEYEAHEVRVWEAAARLPSFAARGTSLRTADDPPPGLVWVRVEVPGGAAVSRQQDAAIAHLLDREPVVFAAVWAELAAEFEGIDADAEVLCTEVVVSRSHADGVAYLGFSFPGLDEEHGFQVVYHPTRGTSWGDWEALNCIVDADD